MSWADKSRDALPAPAPAPAPAPSGSEAPVDQLCIPAGVWGEAWSWTQIAREVSQHPATRGQRNLFLGSHRALWLLRYLEPRNRTDPTRLDLPLRIGRVAGGVSGSADARLLTS